MTLIGGTFFACSIIKDLFEIPYVINWNKLGKLQKKKKKRIRRKTGTVCLNAGDHNLQPVDDQ